MTSAGSTVGFMKVVATNVIFLYGDLSYKFWPSSRFHIEPFVSRWETVNAAETRKTLGFVWHIDKVKLCLWKLYKEMNIRYGPSW
jgi:hypothetical protein